MKEIPLTRGMVALVDDEDYEALREWKWYYHKGVREKTGYAARNIRKQNGERGTIRMHRIILNTPLGYETDHLNGDGLDNRKENLRCATKAQNLRNVGVRADNVSGYKGVSWHRRDKRWQALIRVNRRRIYLGYFNDKLEAARAYNAAATKLYGEFACLNQGVI